MKIKTSILVMFYLQLSVLCNAQSLSNTVRQDFCKNAIENYYYGTGTFSNLMNISANRIGLDTPLKIDIAVQNLCSNIKLQNEVFKNIHELTKGLFEVEQYMSIGMRRENAIKLVDYYTSIESIRNRKELELSKINVQKEKKNRILNYEPLHLSELNNNPTLTINDTLNIKNDLFQIVDSLMNRNIKDEKVRFSDLKYSFIFEVDSSGNISHLINSFNNKKVIINLKSLKFNEGGYVIDNNNIKKQVSFVYPLKITVTSSNASSEIDVSVKRENNNYNNYIYNIECIDTSPYASSPAGIASFEKKSLKNIPFLLPLKNHILNESPVKTTKSFLGKNTTYRKFKVDKYVININLENDEKVIYKFNDAAFSIKEETN